MISSPVRFPSWAGILVAGCFLSTAVTNGASIIAGPGEAGLRAAITAAQEGDTVILKSSVELQATVRIEKRLTFRGEPPIHNSVQFSGSFNGELFQVAADGITFEMIWFVGSPQTDGLFVEEDVILRDCNLWNFRDPVTDNFWSSPWPTVRLERVTVSDNQRGLGCSNLEARDSTFSFNGTSNGGWIADVERCVFERNRRDGFILVYGRVKDCTFRFNGDLGLRFDPDPGTLALSGSLFYGNIGGGLLIRESAEAIVDNCTFTRHTGRPAIVVEEYNNALFRHCTVVDNLFISNTETGSWPPEEYSGAFSIRNDSTVELQNCLIAGNPTNNAPNSPGLAGKWIDGGGNVIGGSAQLGILSNNGGPTLTLLPLPGSPAIDAGHPSDVVTDARGLSRLAGAAPDAGAVESDAQPIADVDKDGLPDNWELFRGLSPADSADANTDGDGDGQTALAEFQSRTDPNNPQSVLRFTEIILPTPPTLQPTPRIIYFIWELAPGAACEVETSTDLRQWQRAPYGSGFTGGRITYEVKADSPMAFYRLKVRRADSTD